MTGTTASDRAFVPFALERWFAVQEGQWMCDLSPSGANALTLDELLAIASRAERDAFARSSLGYGPPDGSEALRSLIAERYSGAHAHDVVVTCGAIEALYLSISALVSPGDEVIVQRPMYAAVTGIARAFGAHVVTWDVEERADTWGRIEILEHLLTRKTRVVAIAQPNNPTGDVLGLDEIAALIDLIGPLGVWLLSDEVYRDLVLDRDLTVTSAVERYGHAISIGDVAKPFGLGGLRVGWLVARDDAIRERIRARRDYTTLSTPTLSDTLAQIALRHSAELLRRPVASARQNLAALTALAMRDHAVSFVRPRAGLTAFVRVDGAFALQQRLAADGILVVPGDLFDCPDHLRIWLGASIAEFSHALEHITRHLSPSAVQRGEELVTDST